MLNRKWNLVSGDGIKVEKIYSQKNIVELTVGKIILYPEMKILVCGSKKSRPRFSIEKVNGFRKKECGKSIENVVEKSEVSLKFFVVLY